MAAERAHVAAPEPLGDAVRVEPVRARQHAHLLAVLKALQADGTLGAAAPSRRTAERLLLQVGRFFLEMY